MLIVTDAAQKNMLYKNTASGGAFEEWSAHAIMTETAHYATNRAVFADYTGDGKVDLFMATDTANVLWKNAGSGVMAKVNGAISSEDASTSSRDALFADYDGDGDLDLMVLNGGGTSAVNFVYQNVNGVFKKVSGAAPATTSADSLTAAFGDYDNDGDLDLVVVNKFAFHVFENAVTGDWHQVTASRLIEGAKKAFGGAWADIDGDGDLGAPRHPNDSHPTLIGGCFGCQASSNPSRPLPCASPIRRPDRRKQRRRERALLECGR